MKSERLCSDCNAESAHPVCGMCNDCCYSGFGGGVHDEN